VQALEDSRPASELRPTLKDACSATEAVGALPSVRTALGQGSGERLTPFSETYVAAPDPPPWADGAAQPLQMDDTPRAGPAGNVSSPSQPTSFGVSWPARRS